MSTKKYIDSTFSSITDNESNMPLYRNQTSDSWINQAYQEKTSIKNSKSLYLLSLLNVYKWGLIVYDIESQKEKIKDLRLLFPLFEEPVFVLLPNDELLFFLWPVDGYRWPAFSADFSDYSFPEEEEDLGSYNCINDINPEDSSSGLDSENPKNNSDSDLIHFKSVLECKYSAPDIDYRFIKVPYKPSSWITTIYFSRSVYCFLEDYSFRYDLDSKRFITFPTFPEEEKTGPEPILSVVFNHNILICGINCWILMYSIDIESFSKIPYKFKKETKKIILSTEIRLYLIEPKKGSIYESEARDEYTWKKIGKSIIYHAEPNQIYFSYYKGDFYISLHYASKFKFREYFKFDLNRKVLVEMSCHCKHSSITKLGKITKVIECWNKAIEPNSNDVAEFINTKHSLYYLVDHLVTIDDNIKRKDDKKLRDTEISEINCVMGEAYNALGFNLKAIKYLNKTIEIEPNNAIAYNYKGLALSDLGRDLEAIECYNEAIKFLPKYADAYYNKGNALKNLERFPEAIENFSEAIKCNIYSFSACLNKGNTLALLGNDLEAIDCYSEAIKRCYKNAKRCLSYGGLDILCWKVEVIECYMGKGNILCKLNRNLEAIECYDKVIKLALDNADAYNNKGKALSNLDRDLEAMECYNEAIKLAPDEHQFLKNRARLFEKLGQQNETFQDFNIADDLVEAEKSRLL